MDDARSLSLMNNHWKFVVANVVLLCLAGGHALAQAAAAPPQIAGNCGMQLGGPVIFCDTFDTKKDPAIQSRTGDLDPNVWGVSRATGNMNFAVGFYNGWAASTSLQTCNGTVTATPPNDIVICNGQLREATNDNPTGAFDAGTVTTLAMYPKQPFDFAGRTGTVSFDVSNDSSRHSFGMAGILDVGPADTYAVQSLQLVAGASAARLRCSVCRCGRCGAARLMPQWPQSQ